MSNSQHQLILCVLFSTAHCKPFSTRQCSLPNHHCRQGHLAPRRRVAAWRLRYQGQEGTSRGAQQRALPDTQANSSSLSDTWSSTWMLLCGNSHKPVPQTVSRPTTHGTRADGAHGHFAGTPCCSSVRNGSVSTAAHRVCYRRHRVPWELGMARPQPRTAHQHLHYRQPHPCWQYHCLHCQHQSWHQPQHRWPQHHTHVHPQHFHFRR